MKWNKLIVILILLSTLVLSGCVRLRPAVSVKADMGLNQVRDMEDLKSLLGKRNTYFFNSMFGMFATRDNGMIEDAAPEAGNSDSSNSHSTTNVQVEGVDEGDIIKTDGSRIYYINNDTLRVIDLVGDGTMEVALQERLTSADESIYRYAYFNELYITDRYLVVIGQTWQYTYYDATGGIKDPDSIEPDVDFGYIYSMSTSVTVVLLYDIVTLERVKTVEVSGSYLTSRLVGDSLYFISNHFLWYGMSNGADYDPRPWFKIDGEITIPSFTDIKYVPDMYYQSFTNIVSMKLAEEVTVNQQVFLGRVSWGQVYMNLSRLYFAFTDYEYDIFGNYKQKGTLISYELNHDEATVSYGGAGTYMGYIINQFAMDEYNGYMRIVTTEGWGDLVKNRLYVFEPLLEGNNKVLTEVASIQEGIGKPRETVRSVRFQRDVVTVVTYELTDPFYTIDLSDPYNPYIRGALEVTGFSLYQHPWTDTLVIGIGQEAEGNNILGLKLSLYDISDIDNPVEIGTPLVMYNQAHSWVWSEALYNHKSILVAKDYDMIGFGISRDRWFMNFYSTNNDYILFDINPESATPITIKEIISHYHLFTDNTEDYRSGSYSYFTNFNIDRAVYANDYLYAISSQAITSHNLVGTFDTVSELIFVQLDQPTPINE